MNKIFSLLHPLLFALFFIFALFAHNREQVLYQDLITPLVLTALGVAVISAFFLFLFRMNWQKAMFATTLSIIFFFAYGHVFDPGGEGNYWIRTRYFLPFWTMLWVFSIGALFWLRRDIFKFALGLTLIALSMNTISVVSLIRYEFNNQTTLVIPLDPVPTNSFRILPDIYFILPDAYSSAWALKDFFDYDNSAFENFLKEKGFYVAPKSRSNYHSTALSMASLLNLDYLEALSKGGEVSNTTTNPRQLIAENRVGKFLQSLGYTYIHLGSWWEGDFRVPFANENINKGFMSEFMLNLFKKTAIYPAAYHYDFFNDRYMDWKRMRYQFDEMAKIPKRKEPTFTFFHLGAPHGPYVFHADGSFIESLEEPLLITLDDEQVKNPELHRKYYPGQLTYVTERLIALVETILAESEIPPIIIIQSDHGSSLFKRSDPDYRRNKLKNFSAFFLPPLRSSSKASQDKQGLPVRQADFAGQADDWLWEDITPVNTFRVIFNYYFGTDYEMLPDRSYALTAQDNRLHPDLDLVDVTEEVAKDYE